LRNKKNIVIALVLILVFSAAFLLLFYPKSEIKAPEELDWQKLTEADFSKADLAMPKDVLDRIRENYEKAQEKLEKNPYDYEANMQKAAALYALKEYGKAEIIYKKLSELYPDKYLPFKSLGDVYTQEKRYKEAEAYYLKAIEKNPYNPQNYESLADIYRYHLKGDRLKIEKFYQNGIKKLGNNRFPLVQSYASYLEDIGETEKALEQWKILAEEFPSNQSIKEKVRELESEVKN